MASLFAGTGPEQDIHFSRVSFDALIFSSPSLPVRDYKNPNVIPRSVAV